ncbi:hypothetical protein F0562_019188 [Nyssa sinensis]|uniref:MBD domain-containing protein n=1 Tax=Nyssa sinensis TaxID=561372 RepID=A0A5J4ZDJ4_9ASTE|nr:hypothetical protein F0562_019188 [Nyssa sinensis]
MADKNQVESLPPDWILTTETRNDGSEVKCYTNSKTGQTFYTKEDLLRYVHYATHILPRISEFTLEDFLEGRVPTFKDKAVASSSVPAAVAKPPKKPQHKKKKHGKK